MKLRPRFQSIAVHLYLDGPAGTGTLLPGNLADVPRADVNKNTGYPGDHGFEIKLPGSVFDGQPHELYAYGIDAQGTKNAWLNGSPYNFTLIPEPDGGADASEDDGADAGPNENERGDTDAGGDGAADEKPGSDGCGCRASGGSDSKCGVLLLLLGLLVIIKKSGRV